MFYLTTKYIKLLFHPNIKNMVADI